MRKGSILGRALAALALATTTAALAACCGEGCIKDPPCCVKPKPAPAPAPVPPPPAPMPPPPAPLPPPGVQ
jgi:hypothetical protein